MLFCSTGGSTFLMTSWEVGVSSRKMAAHKSLTRLDACCGSLVTFLSSWIKSVGTL